MLGFRLTILVLLGLTPCPQAHAHKSDLDLRTLVSKDLDPKTFGPAKWLDKGAAYTTLEESKSLTDSKSAKDAKDIVRYETASGKRSILIGAQELIPQGAEKPLQIDDYEWSKDKQALLIFTNAQKVWRRKTRGDYCVLDRSTGRLHELGGNARPATLMFASFAADGRRVAYLRRDADPTQMATNLYVEDWTTGAITQLTNDGQVRRTDGTGKTIINGTGDWVNEEEFDLRKGYEWAPDGRHIAYWQFDATAVQDFFLINNTDTVYPVITPIAYPKTGTANSTVRVGIVSAYGGPTRWLELSDDPANHYIPRLAWSEDSREVFLQHFDRPQQNLDLFAADAATGEVRKVLHEESNTWIDAVDDFKWLRKGREFLWVSERDGWRHVYVVPRSGGAQRLVTPGEFDVVSIAGFDEKRGWLYFIASPDNATQRYLYRANLRAADTKQAAQAVQRITPVRESGTHAYDVSSNGRWALQTYSQLDSPPATALVSLPDHRRQRALLDNEALRTKLAPLLENTSTEFFQVAVPTNDKGVAGHATLDGWMIKPPHFDPKKKYPVVVYVYSEPAAQAVLDRWGGKRMLFHHYLAEQGYVVLCVDNRGTPAPKGHAWRHVIYGAIGVLAAEEQAAAVRKLAAQRPYLDLDRVAVWGWSGGGSMTLHLMFRHPQLYKAGISVAPMPDQLYYDTVYQERYMGLPQTNPEGYKKGSAIHYAEGLKGDLLVVSGSGDDNCHFQMTELLLNRLIKLGKQFDFMEYPNRSHSIDEGEGTTPHLFTTLARYFTTHVPAGAR